MIQELLLFPNNIIIILTIAGVISSRIAISQIKRKEDKSLDKVNDIIDWKELRGEEDSTAWIKSLGVSIDTHIGKILLCARDAMMARRSPSLAELNSLSTRFERERLFARFGGGVAKILLIVGITGTLYGVHGVIDDFKIVSSESGRVDTAKAGKEFNELFSQLANAFIPSLVALIGTIICFGMHGYYLSVANQFASKLDNVIIKRIFPVFSIPDENSQLSAILVKLREITDDTVEDRRAFIVAADNLKAILSELIKADVGKVSEKIALEVNNFSDKVDKLGSSMNRHFGKRSPVVEATNNFKKASLETIESVKALKEMASGVKVMSDENKTLIDDSKVIIKESLDVIKGATDGLPEKVDGVIKEGVKEIKVATKGIAEESGKVIIEAVEEGAENIQGTIKGAGIEVVGDIRNVGSEVSGTVRGTIEEAVAKEAERLGEASHNIENASQKIKETAESIKASNDELEENVKRTLDAGLEKNITRIEKSTKTLDQIQKKNEGIFSGIELLIKKLQNKYPEGLGQGGLLSKVFRPMKRLFGGRK